MAIQKLKRQEAHQHRAQSVGSVRCSLSGELSLDSTRSFCINYILRNKTKLLLQSKKGDSRSSSSEEEMQHTIKGNRENTQ